MPSPKDSVIWTGVKCFLCEQTFYSSLAYYECLRHVAKDHLNQKRDIEGYGGGWFLTTKVTCWCHKDVSYTPNSWISHIMGMEEEPRTVPYADVYEQANAHYTNWILGRKEEG